jgi:uncharacterized membrane protein YfcA
MNEPTWTTYWFMMPVALVVSTLANLFGVGGAVLFSPIFVIVFPLIDVPTLTAADAFGGAIVTVVAGFGSGSLANAWRQLINYRIVCAATVFSIPFAVAGAALRQFVPSYVALYSFALVVGLLGAFRVWFQWWQAKRENVEAALHQDEEQGSSDGLVDDWTVSYLHIEKKQSVNLLQRAMRWIGEEQVYRDSDGSVYRYSVSRLPLLIASSVVGALFVGFVSVGMGELVVTALQAQQRIPFKIASATSVFIVLVTALAASSYNIAAHGIQSFPWKLLVWTMPAVVVGAQLGAWLASRVDKRGILLERALTGLFFLIAIVMGVEATLQIIV